MRLSDFIADIGRPVAYYPGLRKVTGSTTATVFLCQLIYWTGKERSGDGWIYKTSEDIEKETGLSYEEQMTARKNLKARNLLDEEYKRIEHQMYFRVNMNKLDEAWAPGQHPDGEMGNTQFPNKAMPSSLIESETTTETTFIARPFAKSQQAKRAAVQLPEQEDDGVQGPEYVDEGEEFGETRQRPKWQIPYPGDEELKRALRACGRKFFAKRGERVAWKDINNRLATGLMTEEWLTHCIEFAESKQIPFPNLLSYILNSDKMMDWELKNKKGAPTEALR